jgi:hypothetical protein
MWEIFDLRPEREDDYKPASGDAELFKIKEEESYSEEESIPKEDPQQNKPSLFSGSPRKPQI